MRLYDYSQLPVMINERDVKGVVSWKSIGKKHADGHDPKTVGECMETAHEVKIDMMLTDATNRICDHDHVLVRGQDRRIVGIVTAADLADQFKQRAHPFLLIGEIEHHLRNLIRRRFTVDEFEEASNDDKPIKSPDDLTFGGYRRLLENKERWNQLGLKTDRNEFIKHLDFIRRIRNDVMHFSPDEHEPKDTEKLEQFARFLREIVPSQSPIT